MSRSSGLNAVREQLGFATAQTKLFQFHPIYGNQFIMAMDKPRFSIYDIEYMNNTLNQHTIESNDIVICSFLKTGTHWMKKILLEIMKHHPFTQNVERFQTIDLSHTNFNNLDTGLPRYPVDEYPRVYHTHLHYEDLNRVKHIDDNAKLICLARNPKDVAVSMHSMITHLPVCGYDGDMETSIELFLNGFTFAGDYWDHVRGWNDVYVDGKHNILWVYYEDLLSDPLKGIKDVVEHCGLNEKGELSEVEYGSIMDKVEIGNVRKELTDNPGNFYEVLDLSPNQFFRKGVSGDWVNHFDDKMSHYYDIKSLMKWTGTDIKYYKELMDGNSSIEVNDE